jgi:hypothetical protein
VTGRLLGLLACTFVSSWSTPALAWGDTGHRIICEIAFQELNDPARERVKAMIRQDPEFDTFAESCSWPDRPRRRAVEHYVNLPRDAEGFAKDPCPVADKCVVSAIEKDLAVLSSPGAREQEKLEALKYLGHWVGDVHQPRPWRQQHRGIRRSLQLGSACGLGRLPHRERCPGGCVRCRSGPSRRRHRRGPGDVAGIHADRLGERVLRNFGQPGGEVLRPHRSRVFV